MAYKVGQRYLSEAEPELGLGMILEIGDKTIGVHFPSSEEGNRTYGIKTAPLKRIIFKEGDKLTLNDGTVHKVDKVLEGENLAVYQCGEEVIPETLLSGNINFSRPMEKLSSGLVDSNNLFELRKKALKYRSWYNSHALKGLTGARIGLIPHQFYIAKEIVNRPIPRVLLSDEVGLGKTIEAALILHQQIITNRSKRNLIIVPNTLVYQWFVELYRKFNLSFKVITEQTSLEVGENPFYDHENVIVSMNLLRGAEKARDLVSEVDWDTVIVDEAHQLRWSLEEGASNEYKVVEEIVSSKTGLILLTATPEQLGEQGHFARLRLLDPEKFSDFTNFQKDQKQFHSLTSLIEKIESNTQLDNEDRNVLTNLIGDIPNSNDEIIRKLIDWHGTGRVYFRNKRETVEKTKKLFCKRILHENIIELDEKSSDKEKFNSKLESLVSLINKLDDEKILLICKTKEVVKRIEKGLKENIAGLKLASFNSDMSIMEKDRQAAYFADPDGARILLCTEVGSEGRNFQFCHHLVLFDLPDNPDFLEQRIGRLDRIGQLFDINIHTMIIKNSLEYAKYTFYKDVLKSFVAPPKGAMAIFEEFQQQLENDNINFNTLNNSYAEILNELERGKDKLVEINSFNEEVGTTILKQIREMESQADLKSFLEDCFNCFGVDIEELNPFSWFIRPGDNMFIPSFPELDSSGMSYTLDRSYANQREDIRFITWDHPMVIELLDLVCDQEFGNVSIIKRKNEKPNFFVELIFGHSLQSKYRNLIERHINKSYERVVLSNKFNDLTDKVTEDLLKNECTGASKNELMKVSSFGRAFYEKLTELSDELSEKFTDKLKEEVLNSVNKYYSNEIERLEALVKTNELVKSELELSKEIHNELINEINSLAHKLDSIRIIF